MIVPVRCLFLIFGLARQLNLIHPGQFAVPGVLHALIFVLSAVTALAGPLFLRTLFAHSMRNKTGATAQNFSDLSAKYPVAVPDNALSGLCGCFV